MQQSIRAQWMKNQNRWQCKVQRDGERKTFTCSTAGRAGKYQCEDKAAAWLENRSQNKDTKVLLLLDKYIQELQDTSGAGGTGHVRQYESLIKVWLKPNIGEKRLSDLTEGHLQTILNKAFAKKKLAVKTLTNIRAVMRSFLKWCRSYGWTALNPENLKIPRGAEKGTRAILYPNDIEKLFLSSDTTFNGEVAKDWHINRYRFAVATGLRPGEIAGLNRADVKDGILRVQRSYNTASEMTRGKTANAQRTMKLSKLQQSIWDAQMLQLKQAGIVSAVAFPDKKGLRPTQLVASRAWERYTKHNGLSDVTPYELRHTWVSLNKAMPDAYKKAAMGHSKDMDTNGVYDHALPDDLKKIADHVDATFNEILNPPKSE